mgnify:FL=1
MINLECASNILCLSDIVKNIKPIYNDLYFDPPEEKYYVDFLISFIESLNQNTMEGYKELLKRKGGHWKPFKEDLETGGLFLDKNLSDIGRKIASDFYKAKFDPEENPREQIPMEEILRAIKFLKQN